MSKADLIKELQELALGTRLKRLSDTLMGDVGRIYKEQHLDFEPKWFTMIYLLKKEKSLSIIEISDNLKLSHPAVVQFADQLVKQKLIVEKKDKRDARKRILELSAKGEELIENLQPILKQVETATHELIQNTAVDLLYAIEKMEKQLDEKSMYERVREGLKKELLAGVSIQKYRAKYKDDFKRLNEEWLSKYFSIEKEDHKILGNPEKHILETGGAVFIALSNNSVVGTVAVTHHGMGFYELNKMAVTKAFQGNSIGDLLMKTAIAFAKQKRAKQLFLETNHNLRAAVHLYEKYGFKREDAPLVSKYKRSTAKMILDLK